MKRILAIATSLIILCGNTIYAQDYVEKETSTSVNYDSKIADELFLNSKVENVQNADGIYQVTFVTDYMPEKVKRIAKASANSLQSNSIINSDEVKAKSIITLATTDQEKAKKLVQLTRSSVDDSVKKSQWDDTYGVKGYLTVYYVENDYSGITTCLVTQVDGGATISDTNIQIVYNSKNKLIVGCNDGHPNTYNQYKEYKITSIPFYKSTPSSWEPADVDQDVLKAVGATWNIPLRRANTNWNLEISNTLYGSMIIT
ncbi:hypothetical protein [Anaerotignum sp.]|uniref:hypothetical protein n=1 Tax=Anaerotignum sp. TaxID=2039241 RepID=UPI0028A27968|nr:hypothetical protein [Anaerotignum sp.]